MKLIVAYHKAKNSDPMNFWQSQLNFSSFNATAFWYWDDNQILYFNIRNLVTLNLEKFPWRSCTSPRKEIMDLMDFISALKSFN